MRYKDEMVDRAAQYLRDTQQAGRFTLPWRDLPKSSKKKWLVLARGTLEAAVERRDG